MTESRATVDSGVILLNQRLYMLLTHSYEMVCYFQATHISHVIWHTENNAKR